MVSRDKGWKLFRERFRRALPGLAALLIITILKIVGVQPLDHVGDMVFDSYQRAAPRAFNPDMPARIIDIDDESIEKLGQWPWPRSDMARLTEALTQAGASAVAYDVVFSEIDRTAPDQLAARAERDGASPQTLAALKAIPDPDAVFANAIQGSPVVLGYFLGHDARDAPVEPKAGMAVAGSPPTAAVESYTSSIQPLPGLRDAASGLGFLSLPPDKDGVVRRAPLIAAQGDQLLPALSVDALRAAQGAGSVIVKSSDASGEYGNTGDAAVTALKVGEFEVPTTASGALWMYYTAPHPERVVPAWKILTGALTPEQMEKEFAGRIVFVGASAQGLYDLKSTPLEGRAMGVAIHAQAVEQMVFQQFLQRPDWGEGLERVALVTLGLILALTLPWIGARFGAVLGVVMVGGVLIASWIAFTQHRYLIDPTYPVLGLIAVWIVETVYTYYREERQRAYIHQAFDRYLSPEMVKRIVDDPSRLELGGEEREMTVLFCDVRQFSRISERLSPKEIIRFLIAFLTPMCDILLARKATIDKFIGDAILAFWNAPLDDPDQYRNAARGALEMIHRLGELNVDVPQAGVEPWPGEVKIGIGLNSGPCCVGNMGSAQRLSYSLIGDTVNLASRLEGLTKYYGVHILMGEDLHAHLPEFATIEVDRVRVVGRDAPETVFALIGDTDVAENEAFAAFAAAHAQMVAAYRAKDWDKAQAIADAGIEGAEEYGLTKLYALMQGRIAHFRTTPPEAEWDGVFDATEK